MWWEGQTYVQGTAIQDGCEHNAVEKGVHSDCGVGKAYR